MAQKEEGLLARLSPRGRANRKKQKQIDAFVDGRISAAREVDLTYGKIPQDKVLDMVLASDMEKIRLTLEQADRQAFDLAVDMLLRAETIYVTGIRSCAPLASFLSFYLHQIFPDVRLVTTSSMEEIFEQLIRIHAGDVLIGISFPRYSMRTLKAMEFANMRSAGTISITDSIHSPLNLYSSCNLIAKSDMASIVDSLVAPMSLINALIVALCLQRQREVAGYLREEDSLWDEFQFYRRDEMNLANLTDEGTEDISLIDPDKETK